MDKLFKVSRAMHILLYSYCIIFVLTGALAYFFNHFTITLTEQEHFIFAIIAMIIYGGVLPVCIAYRIMQKYIVNHAPNDIDHFVLDYLVSGLWKKAKEEYEYLNKK